MVAVAIVHFNGPLTYDVELEPLTADVAVLDMVKRFAEEVVRLPEFKTSLEEAPNTNGLPDANVTPEGLLMVTPAVPLNPVIHSTELDCAAVPL